MDNLLRKRADLFGKYVSAEIKGAIVAQGFTQTDVAKGINRQSANLSRWLGGKPTIPIEVALEVCNYTGVDLQKIVDRAQQRVQDELGPWPPITVNPDAMSEDEKKQWTLDHMEDYGFAANTNPNKEQEMKSDGTV